MVAEVDSLDLIENRKPDEKDCSHVEGVDPARRSNAAATNSTHVEIMGNDEQQRYVSSSVKKSPAEHKLYTQQVQHENTEKGLKLQNNEKSKNQSNLSTKSLETSQQTKEPNNKIPAKTKPNSLLESHDSDCDTLDRSNLPLSSGQFSHLTTDELVTNKVTGKNPLSKSDRDIVPHTDGLASKIQTGQAASNSVKPECVNNSSKKPKGTHPSAAPSIQTAPPTQVKLSELPTKGKADESSENEEVNEARLPLVSRYGSFIHPTDTSLAEARRRLRIAIDQTRRLRIAFTERVYDKYRVILYPPPSSVDKIVEKITADPAKMNSKLQEKLQELKEEKDLEKKEAQRLTAAGVFDTSNSDGKPVSPSSIETAEQLAYIGAGLSLVILPDQDIQDHEIDLGRFKHRGPTNPETGQRVSGISQAAATAAEVLLDRVRRATTLRSERQRRHHLSSENTPGTADEQDIESILSRYNLLSAVVPSTTAKIKVSERAKHVIVDQLSAQSKKSSKAPGKSQLILNKHGRVPIQSGISGTSMLTLEPLVEDLDSEGKISSSTAGLVLCGVGYRANQPRWKNQYSEFIDESRLGNPANKKKLGDLAHLQTISGADNGKTNRDPPSSLLHANMEANVHLPVMDSKNIATKRAKKAVHLILSQFVSTDDNIAFGTNFDVKSQIDAKKAAIDRTSTSKSKSNRWATEIGLMHGLKHSTHSKDNSSNLARDSDQHCSVTENPPKRQSAQYRQIEKSDIEPIVAFSVLQALGLIIDTPSSQKESQPTVSERLLSVNPSSLQSLSQTRTDSSERLVSIYSKAISKKRTFTEAFASKFSLSIAESANALPQSNLPHEKELYPKVGTVINEAKHSQEIVLESPSKMQDNCPVVSMRGGGNESIMGTTQESLEKTCGVGYPDSSNFDRAGEGTNRENLEASTRPKSAPDTTHSPSRARNSSRPSSSSSAPIHSSSTEGMYSVLAQNRVNNGPTYPQQGNGHFGLAPGAVSRRGVTDRIQAQAHQLQLHAAAMNGLSQGGEISDFLNANLHQRSGFTGRPDWSAIQQTRQSAVNLLPSHSSLALGMNPHQAAMLELSARDRAARALLAREQQAAIHAAAVHRQQHQQQHAAALMNAQASQSGGGIFSTSSAARYNQLGPHSAATAAAILSSPAAAALIGQTQIASGTLSSPVIVGQHSDSRPSSQHSTSSNKSGKGKRPASRGRREVRDENIVAKADSAEPMKIQTQPKVSVTSSKRKASELSLAITLEKSGFEPRTAKAVLPKEPETKKLKPSSNGATKTSLISSNEHKKAKPKESKKIPCKELKNFESRDQKMQSQASTKEKIGDDTVVVEGASPEIQSPKPETSTPGMQFIVPPIPPMLDSKMSSCILEGRIHVALGDLFESSGNLRSATIATAVLDYLQAVGSSVPIPKALISSPLRERLNAQSMKTIGNGGITPNIPRDLVVSIILVWLWMQHKDTFRRAFAKSGRIDVDPECKWLIHAAIDAVSRAILAELVDASQNGGPLASAISSARSKAGTTKVTGGSECNNSVSASTTLDSRLTMIASKALMTELCIDEGVDSVLVMYEDFVKLIDETRIQSLRAKCVERVLLASLVSKYSTMPESFAHAYVSSMVRAGEALGHGELFELVQDEDVSASTMIPYDIFSDETGAWEDPCRRINGFSPNLTGEDLVRQAHARAMIVKSLKKMQDRNNIKGGTSTAGPYIDKTTKQAQAEDIKIGNPQQRAPTGSLRRRSASWTDSSIKGIGSGKAIKEAHYRPRHVSTPLFWDENAIENLPYGKYENGNRPRAFSTNSLSPGNDESNADGKRHVSLPSNATPQPHVKVAGQGGSRRSTEEIVWSEVACVFKIVDIGAPVTTPRRRTSKLSPQPVEQPKNPLPKTIIAPFCNRIDDSKISIAESDSEEEDITDKTILARHTVVLNKMKERLDKFMEGRTTAGQRARQRAKQRVNEKITLSEKKTSTLR
mmetsp:Transcript_7401/g.11620  ORF Transcript_7401/g.11620 Transcript_7401/m.11620 type:complete len:1964 (+) Transcript_7401:138-6029(+)